MRSYLYKRAHSYLMVKSLAFIETNLPPGITKKPGLSKNIGIDQAIVIHTMCSLIMQEAQNIEYQQLIINNLA